MGGTGSVPGMKLASIFFAALALRWAYAVILFAVMGEDGLKAPDSVGYLVQAHDFAAAITANKVAGWGWLSPNTTTMPVFIWLITLHTVLFGSYAALAYVLMQGVLDAATCVLVHGIAGSFDRSFAMPAAIASVLNPTQIVLSGLVLTDTPFTFLVALTLLGSVRWLRSPAWPGAVLIGLGLGGAALCRILIVPAGLILLPYLAVATLLAGRFRLRQAAQLAAAAAIAGLCIGPVLLRNVVDYGSWSLTSQSGLHFTLWVVPFIKQAKDGTPWIETHEALKHKVEERFGTPAANQFEMSGRYQQLGREELAKLGPAAIAKAWLFGAAINLGAPAIITSPLVSNLPRTGFYATGGASLLAKMLNFLFRSDNALFAWILAAGIVGVIIMRLLQFVGLMTILARRDVLAMSLILLGWCVYILVVSGPVAAPKYRLPMEPVFAVLSGAGFARLRQSSRKRAAGVGNVTPQS
jgi:4-amino-4-deoxy-L-arabinose transferase-like glycosyltransferase